MADDSKNEMDPTPIRRRQKGSACVQKCADKKKLPALIHVSEPDHGISGAGFKGGAMICSYLDICFLNSNLILRTRCGIINPEFRIMGFYQYRKCFPAYGHFDSTDWKRI